MKITKHLVISGRVQGVGFRAYILRNADKLNIRGWVRNVSNGDVETVISGEKLAVEKILNIIKKGPRWASITNITTICSSITQEEYTDFKIRY